MATGQDTNSLCCALGIVVEGNYPTVLCENEALLRENQKLKEQNDKLRACIQKVYKVAEDSLCKPTAMDVAYHLSTKGNCRCAFMKVLYDHGGRLNTQLGAAKIVRACKESLRATRGPTKRERDDLRAADLPQAKRSTSAAKTWKPPQGGPPNNAASPCQE